jgi:thiol:disulfide interchange protein
LLATPCTAPFLAGAVGFAFTQPPVIIILIFLAVGLGLATPYVLLCWHPGWLKLLPKPGLWMQRFKVAMGFPMLATAMWLFWLTATRMGKSGVLWFGLFLVVLALAAWVWGEFAQRGRKCAGLAIFVSLVLAGSAYGFILENKLHWRSPANTVTEKDAINWQTWSTAAVEKARAAGHPVLVDFTADSCVNCQWNLYWSIDVPETREKLKQINAVTLEGDYTDQDKAIARELQRFGEAGVPLVLVYPADKSRPPIVMPPRFKKAEMLDALDKVSKP